MKKNPCHIIFSLVALLSLFACQEPEQKFEIQEATIADLHQAIRNGSCSCEEIVLAYLERINRYDQSKNINSIVIVNPAAIDRAKQLDDEFARDQELQPLHCVPVIVKDNYNTVGLPTSAGSLAMQGFVASADAYQVRVLKEAGAIVLAKSNMAEWAFSPKVTISSIAGETRNPYNTGYVPAGSSGGTAAAVAANFGLVGLGTDTGNSIRGPSSHNALVGFRTTLGLTSRAGIVPLYLRNDVGGPMCRTVTDATRILEAIAGYDPDDPLTKYGDGKVPDSYTQFLQADGLQGARIGVLRVLSDAEPDEEISRLFEQAIIDMRSQGAELVEIRHIQDFDSLRNGQWCPVFQHDLNQFLEAQGKGVPVKSLAEVVASGKYSEYIKDRLEFMLEHKEAPGAVGEPCSDAFSDPRRTAFRQAIVGKMDSLKLDALIYPTWNNRPAKIGRIEDYKGDNSQVIAPHTGQPAFTIPMGYTSGNLPAGLQFLARPFDEPILIKLVYAYEQATRHRKPPTGLE
jgi:Asp-tRNA(Asn)/Glu-tRNA(Gln) amidotransferase A subunit family amidase